MKSANTTILTTMNVLFWIIFIGLCIKTGAMLFSLVMGLLYNTAGVGQFYDTLNLNDLYAFSRPQYFFSAASLIAVTGLKAYIAYLVVRIFMKFDFSSPFNPEMTDLIFRISHYALGTGLLAMAAGAHSDWLGKKGIAAAGDWGGGEILFFAGVIYILAEVFRKGTELQTESELTV